MFFFIINVTLIVFSFFALRGNKYSYCQITIISTLINIFAVKKTDKKQKGFILYYKLSAAFISFMNLYEQDGKYIWK